jgi:hypothetical protein
LGVDPEASPAEGVPHAQIARRLGISRNRVGDQAVAAAMIDRIVHHADVLTLKGACYRLPNRGIDTLPSIRTESCVPAAPN